MGTESGSVRGDSPAAGDAAALCGLGIISEPPAKLAERDPDNLPVM